MRAKKRKKEDWSSRKKDKVFKHFLLEDILKTQEDAFNKVNKTRIINFDDTKVFMS